MTEHEWLTSADPRAMLQHLQTGAIAFRYRPGGFPASYPAPLLVATDRKLTLFSDAALSIGYCQLGDHGKWATLWDRADHMVRPHDTLTPERLSHLANLLRDIFGNPWRPVTLQPHWLTPTVKALAQAAYDLRLGSVCPTCHTWGIDTVHDERTGRTDHVTCPTCHGYGYLDDGNVSRGWLNPARLAVLSDALMEAGCDCEEILSHLCIQSHVRGCWVVDLLLGKS